MDSDARHDFAAADAPHSPRNDRRFVYPEARSLPDSEEESDGGEETSPSQYKRDRMREESSHFSDGSNGGSSDEEVEVPEEYFSPDEVDHEGEVAPRAVMSRKAALKVDCDAMIRNLNAMSQQLQAVMRLQKQHKRERMRCEDVEDGDPGPATLANRARAADFTPPRKKRRELVPPTPGSDEDDLESLVSQASSTRKKVQPKFIFVESKDTPKFNESEIRSWLQAYAIEQMNKAGPYIDKRPRETDLGGMKLSQVSAPCFLLFMLSSGAHQRFVCSHIFPKSREDFIASNFTVHSAGSAIAFLRFPSRRTATGLCFSSRASTRLIVTREARVC
jgi:hypothetical protein